jgi:hypothetical protein
MPPKPSGTEPVLSQAKPRGAKSAAAASVVRPGLVVAAVVLFWAAMNEPALFTPTSVAVWLLTAVAVGLLARAGLALLEPLARLGVTLARRWAREVADRAAE